MNIYWQPRLDDDKENSKTEIGSQKYGKRKKIGEILIAAKLTKILYFTQFTVRFKKSTVQK